MLHESYKALNFKKPIESIDYDKHSILVINLISNIIKDRIVSGRNKILINTNLKLGLPMENINKIAGPIIEAWAFEVFNDEFERASNEYNLISVYASGKLDMSDIVLQVKLKEANKENQLGITANIDVKSTSEDIKNSGKSPNLTSFARIRTMYLEDPDYMFVILSLKHRVYITKKDSSSFIDSTMEVISYNCYDLKYISDADISYNPSLGTGQIQIKDINYVDIVKKSTWDFCQLLDNKFINSKKGFDEWLVLAKKFNWIK
jgi:hypothetical protein